MSSGQLVEQALGLFQIERVKAFGKPAIDRNEKLTGLIPLPLIAPEPRHASLPQVVEQVLGFLHHRLIETFGEPAVDWRE
jgi:hypothetical protein